MVFLDCWNMVCFVSFATYFAVMFITFEGAAVPLNLYSGIGRLDKIFSSCFERSDICML